MSSSLAPLVTKFHKKSRSRASSDIYVSASDRTLEIPLFYLSYFMLSIARKDEEAEETSRSTVDTGWISQLLDHI